jgi:acyl carrier protein
LRSWSPRATGTPNWPSVEARAQGAKRLEAWDSVQHLNLVLALEGRYGIQLEPEEMEGMRNLGRIAALLGSKIT